MVIPCKQPRAKNRLRERDIHRIVDVFTGQREAPGYSRMVPLTEIASEANDYNLNIPRYIDSREGEDLHDLAAHLHGGIPNRDIDALGAYWEVFPGLLKRPAGFDRRHRTNSDTRGPLPWRRSLHDLGGFPSADLTTSPCCPQPILKPAVSTRLRPLRTAGGSENSNGNWTVPYERLALSRHKHAVRRFARRGAEMVNFA